MNSLWFFIATITCCIAMPLKITEIEHNGTFANLPVIVTRGGWVTQIEDVVIYTEEHSVTFMLPDVPDPLKQTSKNCPDQFQKLVPQICELIEQTNRMNSESFKLEVLLNKVLTSDGLQAAPFTKVSVRQDMFSPDPAKKSAPEPVLFPDNAVSSVGKNWYESVNQMLSKRRIIVNGEVGNIKSKRALPIIIAKAIPFLAKGISHVTKSAKLFVGSNGIINAISKYRHLLPTALKAFTDIPSEESEFVGQVGKYVKEMSLARDHVFRENSTLREKIKMSPATTSRKELELGFWHTQEMLADHSSLLFTSLLYNVHLSALSNCRDHDIPMAFVPPHLLEDRVQDLQNKLSSDYKIAIGLDDILLYYTLKKGQCIMDNDGGVIMVSIPIKPALSDFKLYEFKSVVFQWDDKTCSINVPSTYVVKDESTNTIYPVTSIDEEFCQPHKSKQCLVPSKTADDTEHLCLRTLLEGGSAAQLKDACEVTCLKSTKPSYTQISHDTHIIAHLPENSMLQCNSGNSYNLPQNVRRGALKIKIPCGCELTHGGRTLAKSNEKVCPMPTQPPIIQQVLPAYITVLDDFVPHSGRPDEKPKFTHPGEILNNNWIPPENEETPVSSGKVTWDFPIYSIGWNTIQSLAICYILWRIHLSPAMLLALFGRAQARSERYKCKMPDDIYVLLLLILLFSLLGFVPQWIYFAQKSCRKLWNRAIHNVAEKKIIAAIRTSEIPPIPIAD